MTAPHGISTKHDEAQDSIRSARQRSRERKSPTENVTVAALAPHFRGESVPDRDGFIDGIRSFKDYGQKTRCVDDDGIPYFFNEYWTSSQRKAHSLHEVSYRACFKAQLPEFFISRLTAPGDTVYDPFMGRGTTPLQAAIMDRAAIGNDINPLSAMLVRPRLNWIEIPELQDALSSIDFECAAAEPEELLAFYHPATLSALNGLRNWIAAGETGRPTEIGRTADWIRMVAISRLSGHSGGFFSGRSMPPNQAVSLASQIKINERLNTSPERKNVSRLILKKSASLLRDGPIEHQFEHKFICRDAWNTPEIADASIDLVVTSPPFLDIVDYAADNWLRCWFAGIDTEAVKISKHRTTEAWTDMVRDVLAELSRTLKPRGHVAFEVGEVRKNSVLLERLVWKAAERLPFDRLGVLVNDQQFTKTANCWGITNGTRGTNTNRIVVLRRH